MPTHLSRLQNARTRHPTHDEALAAGRELRTAVPRSAHRELGAGRLGVQRDPLAVIGRQDASRLPELVPLRHERMLASPFSFYRGTAGVMAADLAADARTGIEVVACGDAHVSNFGLFASPQRSLVFDLNDFDEAAPAPWEWDVKRLVASAVVGAQDAGFDAVDVDATALASVEAYRIGIREMMERDVMERFYRRIETDEVRRRLDSKAQAVLDRATRQARRRTSGAFVEKITTRGGDGTLRIVEDPPVLTHVTTAAEGELEELFEQYRSTVSADIGQLLSHFTLTDLVRRVVGVGSVGTRCYLLILQGPKGEALVLQIKEAPPSVLQTFGGVGAPDPFESEGHRVVAGQRILQAVSDPFLGYFSAGGRDYYVRQFRDMKGSIDTGRLRPKSFRTYAAGCGTVLARAHAQSQDAPMIAGYLGRSREFGRAVTAWALDYAALSAGDHAGLAATRG